MGIPVYDADTRAKWLTENDPELIKNVKELLGAEAYKGDKYNRAYVAGKVFENTQLLAALNKLIHPAVGRDFARWVEENKSAAILCKEAALMFESDSYKSLHKIITVVCPLEQRIINIMLRDPQRKREEILKIIDKQLSDDEKIKRSDFVIYNNENSLLITQINDIINKLS